MRSEAFSILCQSVAGEGPVESLPDFCEGGWNVARGSDQHLGLGPVPIGVDRQCEAGRSQVAADLPQNCEPRHGDFADECQSQMIIFPRHRPSTGSALHEGGSGGDALLSFHIGP
jgi:hypothetical protein